MNINDFAQSAANPLGAVFSLTGDTQMWVGIISMVIFVGAAYWVYKEIRRLIRRFHRSTVLKLAAAGFFTTGSGATLLDAWGVPSDLAQTFMTMM